MKLTSRYYVVKGGCISRWIRFELRLDRTGFCVALKNVYTFEEFYRGYGC